MLKRQSNILYRIASFDSHALMSACADPLFVRSLHSRSIPLNRFDGDFINRINPIEIYNNGFFKVKDGVKPRGLTLRSCFDSHKKADQKARALAHRRLGSRPNEERGGSGTTDLADGRGAYLTSFQGNDKIVVAVDIDEGMFPLFL